MKRDHMSTDAIVDVISWCTIKLEKSRGKKRRVDATIRYRDWVLSIRFMDIATVVELYST